MKDFHVTVRIKNNNLVERRKELGLTQRDLAKRIEIAVHRYQHLENLQVSPYGKDGVLTDWALRIMVFFGVQDEVVLWPEQVLQVKKNVVNRTYDAEEMVALTSTYTQREMLPGSSEIHRQELRELITEVVLNSHLDTREINIIKDVYAEKLTYEEIGAKYQISRLRVNQLIYKLSGKLRRKSPAAVKLLLESRV